MDLVCAGIIICISLEHPANKLSLMIFSLTGKSMAISPRQFMNEHLPMSLISFGKSIQNKWLQPLNADCSIFLRVWGSTMFRKLLQL